MNCSTNSNPEIDEMVRHWFRISRTARGKHGIVMLARAKALWGNHDRRIPIGNARYAIILMHSSMPLIFLCVRRNRPRPKRPFDAELTLHFACSENAETFIGRIENVQSSSNVPMYDISNHRLNDFDRL